MRGHAAALLAFLALGALFQLGRAAAPAPVTTLGSDAGNIASFAAALDHPELFRDDPLLGDPRRFRFYFTVHLPLTRALARLTGDYGSAFLAPLALHVALQGMGFYLLGLELWGRRDWAAAAAAALLVPSGAVIGGRFGEAWGVFPDPLPRFSFQALLPFVLCAALRWRGRPAGRAGVMAAAGALTYVHPPSAPAWAAALWAGLWLDARGPWRERALRMAGLALVFAAAAAPFAFVYLGGHEHRASPDAELIRAIMSYRFLPGYADLGGTVAAELWGAAKGGLLPLALAGLLAAWALEPADRPRLQLLAAWGGALLAVCALVPLADAALARARGAPPLQIDLVRGLRYLGPLGLLAALWPLARLERPGRRLACALAASAVIACFVRSDGRFLTRRAGEALAALARGSLHTGRLEDPVADALVRMLPAHVAPGERVLVATPRVSPLAVRYAALRPLAWCRKDGGALAYSDHEALKRWYGIALREDAIRALPEPERFAASAALARELGARWLVAEAGGRLALWRADLPRPR